jgi:hypothetical protein
VLALALVLVFRAKCSVRVPKTSFSNPSITSIGEISTF